MSNVNTLVLPPRERAGLWIFFGCTLLYYLTRSPALDEWDSVQFAFGVGEFNLWKHHPHPPGYPLYIAFGWLAEHLLRLNVHDALALGSAVGGGMFVAGWFVLIARRFPLRVAVISTVALAGLVDTWMTATKVITDPLGAGVLTLALVLLDRGGRRKDRDGADAARPRASREGAEEGRAFSHPLTARCWEAAQWEPNGYWVAKLFAQPWARIAVGALAAAAAVGVRPQNFGILLLIVALAIFRWTSQGWISTRTGWAVGLGAFFAGCVEWMVPVLAIQARTPESAGRWGAYGSQLIAQWRWRLNQPKAFLGASGGHADTMVLYRLDHHVLGWFTRGFGFPLNTPWGWAGLMIVVAGWLMYYLAWLRGRVSPVLPDMGDAGEAETAAEAIADRRDFWRMHLPWAAAYVLMIFCCLPGDQRYYLPIFPLFIVAAVAGWWMFLRGPWRWAALAVPVATLAATLPLVAPNHTEEPPTLRSLRWLQAGYAPAEQSKVWLILSDSLRHAQWYAPGFHVVEAAMFNPANPPEGFAGAKAVYCDDPAFVTAWLADSSKAPGSWHLVQHFQRSPIIYRKHSEADLYQLETITAPVNSK